MSLKNSPNNLFDQPIIEEPKNNISSTLSSNFNSDYGRNIIREPYNEKLCKDGWYNKNVYHKPSVHERLKSEHVLTPRLARENAYYTNNYMRLENLKSDMLQNNPELFNINFEYFLNNPYSKNIYEKCAYYLHFLIIYARPIDVHNFLNKYYEEYCIDSNKKETAQSRNTMRMFINYSLVCHFSKNIITPLICAMLWSNNPKMLRVLYSWGADVSLTDVYNNYCEHIYNTHHYYYNHLHPFVLSRFLVLGLRDMRDFKLVRQEIKYLSQEEQPPPELKWQFPKIHV